MAGVAVGPLEGLGSAIVVTDIAHELAGQVLDRGEDPAGNDIALDPGEPVFDLIEPRGVSRCEVKVPTRTTCEPGFDLGMLMGGIVVDDEMDVEFRWHIGLVCRKKARNSW